MSWDISRRVFLRGAGLAAVGVGLHPSSLMVRTAQAAGRATRALVQVFLRGGCDGLNLCVPHGEASYYELRGPIALARTELIDLDGYFGMHPALGALKPWWDQGRLAFVPAVGNYALTHSHFDAQDFMDSGTPGDKSTSTGWLDRAVARVPGTELLQAVSFSSQLPRSFLGPEPVLVANNLATFDLRARTWRSEAERGLRAMYDARGDDVGRVGRETFSAIDTLLRNPQVQAPPANGAEYPAAPIGNSLRQAAALIKARLGTRCIYVNVNGGFDTHSGQLAANTLEFGRIGASLAAFAQDLGGLLDEVAVVVTTEFGRRAYVNGANGTDHGSGFCMMALGAGVRGGRIHGRWPGLSSADLYQGDVAVTTDVRDAFAEAARVTLGVDTAALFPGYTPGAGPGAFA